MIHTGCLYCDHLFELFQLRNESLSASLVDVSKYYDTHEPQLTLL